MSDQEIGRCSLRGLQLARRHRWELERAQDLRLSAMLAAALDLWRAPGSKPLPPEYLAPWVARRRRPGKQQTPQDIFHCLSAWTAVSGGQAPPPSVIDGTAEPSSES